VIHKNKKNESDMVCDASWQLKNAEKIKERDGRMVEN
jgi:hypothetical protein